MINNNNNKITKKYLAVIPARGGSKRIKKKNLVLLDNKPLIFYTVDAVLSSKYSFKIIVSTDDRNISEYIKSLGKDLLFERPSELAKDTSSQLDVLIHAIKWFEDKKIYFDAVILLQPTSPFRTSIHIDESIELFEKMEADTLTSVCEAKEHPYYMWKMEKEELKPFLTIEHQSVVRQNLPPVFVENGAIYIIRKSIILGGKFYGNRIIPYIMDSESSIDIDRYEDLEFSEFLFKKKRENL